MMPSITWRESRNGRPRCPSEQGINGSIRAQSVSVKTVQRDTTIADYTADL
jgi:hypothetical protein